MGFAWQNGQVAESVGTGDLGETPGNFGCVRVGDLGPGKREAGAGSLKAGRGRGEREGGCEWLERGCPRGGKRVVPGRDEVWGGPWGRG